MIDTPDIEKKKKRKTTKIDENRLANITTEFLTLIPPRDKWYDKQVEVERRKNAVISLIYHRNLWRYAM